VGKAVWKFPLISQSQSHIATDGRSVSMSWCRAQSGTFDQRIFFFKVTVLSSWGVLSDEKSGLSSSHKTQNEVVIYQRLRTAGRLTDLET
jgi:hypothetical protein